LGGSRPTKYETLQQALMQEYLKTIRARQRGLLSHAKVSPKIYSARKARLLNKFPVTLLWQ